jgi:inorganic pyrophosphatase
LEVRLLGGILLKKNGVVNNRLVACPKKKPGVTLKTDSYQRLSDVPKDMMAGIERFLVEYPEEEGNRIDYRGTCSRKKALAMVEKDRRRRRKSK